MHIYYLSEEQKELLRAFSKELMDDIVCRLSDDENSPLDPYEESGEFDNPKLKAMLYFVSEEIKSWL